jgi:hypothetical protein
MGNERERSWGNVGASRARIEVEAGSLPVQKRPMPISLVREAVSSCCILEPKFAQGEGRDLYCNHQIKIEI